MIVFTDAASVPEDFGPSVVAIGKFDGVHSGHRAVIDKARVDATARGARVVAVTFDRNPLSLLRPEICPDDLVGVDQKLALLADAGVDATLLLTFDEQLASLSPQQFAETILRDALHAHDVLVGVDFRFGHRGSGTPEFLRQVGPALGFDVQVVGDVRAVDAGRRVSSTWIREALAEGDVETANRLLGRIHGVIGEVVHGLKRGRELGFPTANLSDDLSGFVPAEGVYAGWLVDHGVADRAPGARTPGRSVRYPAAISIGTNPTFDDVHTRQVEAYVLDETDLDLYGHTVEVQFAARIRPMTAFQGIEALIAQIADDVVKVRAALS
jgi:riboflavin kinase/FMN adenylyltransferase